MLRYMTFKEIGDSEEISEESVEGAKVGLTVGSIVGVQVGSTVGIEVVGAEEGITFGMFGVG